MLNGCLKKRKEAGSMKGYVVDSGYMGYVWMEDMSFLQMKAIIWKCTKRCRAD